MSKEEFVNSYMSKLSAITPNEVDEMRDDKARKLALEAKFMADVPTAFKKGLRIDPGHKLVLSTNSVIYGLYGTGKTHTAYSIAKELYMTQKVRTWRVVREIEIINELRGNSLAGRVFMQYDFLAIDEFGKINDTEFVKAQIFNILDERNDWHKKTLLICNAKDISDLRKIISVAVGDRYKGCLVFLGGGSKRN